MVIEAGVAAAYVIAWAARKARRVGRRLDADADEVIDASLDRLHEVVAAKLGNHPVLAELEDEAGTDDGQVGELTRQQVELAITAAARKDDTFGQAVMELVDRLRVAEQAIGRSMVAGATAAVFAGDAHVHAEGQGIAFGQVGGGVNVDRGPADPPKPGRPSH